MEISELPLTEQLQTPQDLAEARFLLLKLPGIENYVVDPEASKVEIDEGLERMVSEVTKQLDAENMIDFTTFCLGFSQNEREQFLSNPERSPFQSKVELPEDNPERIQQFVTIGTYLGNKYKETRRAKGQKDKDTLKAAKNLRIFYEYSSYNLFAEMENAFTDSLNGVENRKKGGKPNNEILKFMRESSNLVAKESKAEPEELYQEVLTATEGGNYATAFSFLLNHQGNPAVRRTLEAIIEKRVEDRDFTTEMIQFLWQIESYRMLIGIDLEMFYEINQLPEGRVIEKKLHEFLERQEFVTEMRGHLEKEAMTVLVQAEDNGKPIDFWQMLEARASYHNYSKDIETKEQLKDKKEKMWQELAPYLPAISFEETPTSYMDAPTRFGAILRPYNITFPNRDDKLVNVVILDPRSEEILFAEKTGHEVGHKLHAYLLRGAEEAGYVPEQSWDKLPDTIKEEFSQLVEDQVGKAIRRDRKDLKSVRNKSEYSGGEWRNLWYAYQIRRQAPYALVQRAVRLKMEEMWKEGKRNALTIKEAEELIGELEPKVKNFYGEGVQMTSPNQNILNNINLGNPLDGLVYLLKYIEEPKKLIGEDGGDYVGMKQGFSQRFGEIWIDNRQARVVLLALMAETGNNQDLKTYGKILLETEVAEAESRLNSWGISEEKV